MSNSKKVTLRDCDGVVCSFDEELAEDMASTCNKKGVALAVGLKSARLELMKKSHDKIVCILDHNDFIPENIYILYDMGACYVASNGEDISDIIKHIKKHGTAGRDISHFKSITSLYKKYLQEVENKFLQSTPSAQ